jgi:hypothetical protein
MRPITLYVVAQAYGTDPEYILWGEARQPHNTPGASRKP